jgi:hypothetical protein
MACAGRFRQQRLPMGRTDEQPELSLVGNQLIYDYNHLTQSGVRVWADDVGHLRHPAPDVVTKAS